MSTPIPAPQRFAAWDRATLEQFAHDANEQNIQLKAQLRDALDAYRRLVVQGARRAETQEA